MLFPAINLHLVRDFPASHAWFYIPITISLKPIKFPLDLHLNAKTITGSWFQPLWKIWKSVGMIIPNIWKVIKFHGSSHHQPDHH